MICYKMPILVLSYFLVTLSYACNEDCLSTCQNALCLTTCNCNELRLEKSSSACRDCAGSANCSCFLRMNMDDIDCIVQCTDYCQKNFPNNVDYCFERCLKEKCNKTSESSGVGLLLGTWGVAVSALGLFLSFIKLRKARFGFYN